MAAKGLFHLHGRVFSCCFSANSQSLALTPSLSVCYQQARGKRGLPPSKNTPKAWHVKKNASYIKDNFTPENRQFLQEAMLDQYTNTPSPLRNEPWPRNDWTPLTKRTGLLGVKIGVQPQWKKDGTRIQCQLIQIIDNHVIRYHTPEEFQQSMGFVPYMSKEVGCVMVGALSCQPWKYTKAYHNLFAEAGVPPKRKLTRFLVTPNAAIQPGTPLNVNHFKVGDYVDCSAKTIAHGFQGVMKRWGYAGGPASHGATKFHRRPGSLSSGRETGLWKGTKMAGYMGNDWRISKGLKIWRINTKYNVLYVTNPVPGPNHCFVRVYDSSLWRRRAEWAKQEGKTLPMPTCYADDIEDELPEDIYDEELFQFDNNSIQFEETENS